jgi:hypothetical protein
MITGGVLACYRSAIGTCSMLDITVPALRSSEGSRDVSNSADHAQAAALQMLRCADSRQHASGSSADDAGTERASGSAGQEDVRIVA